MLDVQREGDTYLWVRCPNPDHVDKNASMMVNKTVSGQYPVGFGYCHSCGYTIRFSEEAVNKMSKKKAMCRPKIPIDWESLWSKYYWHEDAGQKRWELSNQLKIKTYHISNAGVGWNGESWATPMFNEQEEKIGIQLRQKDGSKLCISGSNLGLFIGSQGNNKVVVTEGLTDMLIANELGYYGIGKPSAGFGHHLVRAYLERIGYEGQIIIVADNDPAGKISALKLNDELKQWKRKTVVPNKDLRQYYLDQGAGTTKALLEI